ncbi:MAG: putative DNA binding domain-containing protein [Prevotella sp.]|nr:putative DNA binding domain-containing protein [Prevotella sp.]MBR6494449.1 putative DNA binding domain-containing protein [Prevotella sp.]
MGKIKTRECQNVEYKSNWRDEYLKWICGFANAQGAVLYFGVSDDHEVVGLDNVDRLMEDIPNKIVTTMGIVADVNLNEQDGLEYIEVVVEPSNIPINYKGKYYYRSGSTMQELRGPALQQFVLKKMGRSWDDVPNDYATIDDLDKSAISYFLRKGYENGRISDEERNAPIEVTLQNLDLINEEGKLKNAALLLFAKKPQKYFTCVQFKIGRFSGSEANLITQDVIEGNIIQMADRVVEILKSKYLTMPVTFEGMNRIEKLEVPEDALREILYNSICHKDYTGVHIQMRVWDDYCEVWNEGELPVGFTPETLLEQHASRPRNRNIANAFFKAGFIDAWGRGYKKIREGFEGAGLPMPKTESAYGGVRVTFQRNNVAQIQPKELSMGLPEGLSVRQKNIIARLIETGQKNVIENVLENVLETSATLSAQFNVNERTIRRDLKTLQTKGVIRRVGPDKGGHWVVIVK